MDWIPGAHHHDLSRRRGNGRFNALHPFLGVALHVNEARNGTPPAWFIAGGGPDEVCPNFQVMKDGTIWQFLPLDWRPWCQRAGNDSFAAIETAGLSREPLTHAQQLGVAGILAHYHRELGLHLVVSNSPHARGLGTHHMGGQAWGGHACPGPTRSRQRAGLLKLAADLHRGATGAKAVPHPPQPARRAVTDAQLRHELRLTAHQLHNARCIVSAVHARRLPRTVAVIATETALTESGLRVLASANVPASQKYPHDELGWTTDGLGHDHASCGLFQQQTGHRYARPGTSTMRSAVGWGTPRELMDPAVSTGKFLDALGRVRWRSLARWEAAQAVQHSKYADGSNYRKQDHRAQRIVAALWASAATATVTSAPRHSAGAPTRTYVVRPGDTLTAIAARHGTTWTTLARLNGLRDPDLILIGQHLVVPAADRRERP